MFRAGVRFGRYGDCISQPSAASPCTAPPPNCHVAARRSWGYTDPREENLWSGFAYSAAISRAVSARGHVLTSYRRPVKSGRSGMSGEVWPAEPPTGPVTASCALTARSDTSAAPLEGTGDQSGVRRLAPVLLAADAEEAGRVLHPRKNVAALVAQVAERRGAGHAAVSVAANCSSIRANTSAMFAA